MKLGPKQAPKRGFPQANAVTYAAALEVGIQAAPNGF